MSIFDTIKQLRRMSFSSQLNTILVFGRTHVFSSRWWVYAYLLNIPLNYLLLECSRCIFSNYEVLFIVNITSIIILGGVTAFLVNKKVSKTEKELRLFFLNEFVSLVLIWSISYLIYLTLSLSIIYYFFHHV